MTNDYDLHEVHVQTSYFSRFGNIPSSSSQSTLSSCPAPKCTLGAALLRA